MNQKFRSSIFLTCQLIFVLLTTTISNTSLPFEPLWIQFLCFLITNTNTCRCTTTTDAVLLSRTNIWFWYTNVIRFVVYWSCFYTTATCLLFTEPNALPRGLPWSKCWWRSMWEGSNHFWFLRPRSLFCVQHVCTSHSLWDAFHFFW